MIAVIAPGPAGLAPPPGTTSHGEGSQSAAGGAFAGVVAAALATMRPSVQGKAQPGESALTGLPPGTLDGSDASPTPEAAPPLAALLALVRSDETTGGPGNRTGSPDRIAEANIDPGQPGTDGTGRATLTGLVASMLAGASPVTETTSPAVAAGDAGTESDGDLQELAKRLLAELVARDAREGERQAPVREGATALVDRMTDGPTKGRFDLVRAQLAATQRVDTGSAAFISGDERGDGENLEALLRRLAGGSGSEERLVDGRRDDGAASARDIARLLESLSRGSSTDADIELDGPDSELSRRLMAAPEGGQTDRVGTDLDLPDGLAPGLSPAMTGSAGRAEGTQQAAAARVTDPALLASQFAETVESAVMRGTSEVRLVLNPPDLGHLDISVVETEQGLRIRLEASQGAARDLMERQLPALQQALEARDLRVERIQVSQATPASAENAADGRNANGEQQTGSRGDGNGSGEAEWSPVAALGLGDETSARASGGDRATGDASAEARSPRGVVDANGRVDVLA